ncbi:murein transglycosylase [Mucilaginibacter sp. PPCGB 2223]|nr:murein transglycosylase [Mucilaginibacter sp. PPCGB 2223]
MIKKCLLTCSVILALMIMFELSFGTEKIRKTPQNYQPNYSFILYKSAKPAALNFANETLPLGDKKVKVKMRLCLQRHSFGNVQSDILHRKAEQWFPIIEPILKAHGIPDDFKYIPLVEAGFGEGKSSRGAYGPWQFMPGTARTYGLRVGKKHDERLDIRKSTIAACKYLNELHGEFKSWVMVAAAYNTGSPNLAQLVRSQKQANYFKMHMNRETGVYVYSLVAMKEIINHPMDYGYTTEKPILAMIAQHNADKLSFD